MTKEEIVSLINKQIIYADNCTYLYPNESSFYYGMLDGLEKAKEIIDMLDKPNNE